MTEHTNNLDTVLPQHELLQDKSFIKKLNITDWLFAAALITIAVLVHIKMPHHMDIYETVILWISAIIAIGLGWFFKPMRWFIVGGIYGGWLV